MEFVVKLLVTRNRVWRTEIRSGDNYGPARNFRRILAREYYPGYFIFSGLTQTELMTRQAEQEIPVDA